MTENSEVMSAGDQLIQKHGLESVADLQVEAHGSVYSVREALGECDPFARFVTGLAASVEFLQPEQAKEVLTQAVRNIALEAPDDPEVKKKLMNPFQNPLPQTN